MVHYNVTLCRGRSKFRCAPLKFVGENKHNNMVELKATDSLNPIQYNHTKSDELTLRRDG